MIGCRQSRDSTPPHTTNNCKDANGSQSAPGSHNIFKRQVEDRHDVCPAGTGHSHEQSIASCLSERLRHWPSELVTLVRAINGPLETGIRLSRYAARQLADPRSEKPDGVHMAVYQISVA